MGTSKHRKFDLNRIKINFYYEGDETLEKVDHRHCGVSILGDIQNPTGHGPEQHAVPDSALSRRLDQTISKGALQPQLFQDLLKHLFKIWARTLANINEYHSMEVKASMSFYTRDIFC